MRTWHDVLNGRALWSCECADALDFLRGLPDDSVDLLVTSPPYENCRTYGLSERLPSGQAWVDWMVLVVAAAAPKVKGLIAINCEGQTRSYSYSGVPFFLFADLKRAGFNMRKPPIFHRVGIPGSGGPDWLRNDYEPIVCVTRPGRLPWSDNTACGHPPKWAPGGEISHRNGDGERANVKVNGWRRDKRVKDQGRISDDVQRYTPPDIANPGNVLWIEVGGGRLGHALAHESEAPFPLELPAFFVKSFAPPNGVVLDCFSGSGTTAHAAVEHGRRFIGCDVRASQVTLCERRMRTVSAPLFTGAEA